MELQNLIVGLNQPQLNESLLQSLALGHTFDMQGVLDVASCKGANLDPKKAETVEIQVMDKTFTVSEYIEFIPTTEGELTAIYAKDKNDYLSQLSVNAKIDVKYSFFNGQFEADFNNTQKSNSENYFSKKSILINQGRLQLKQEKYYTNKSFVDAVNNLPDHVSEENLDAFVKFFDNFGLYYTKSVMLGGKVDLFHKIDKSVDMQELEIRALIKAQVGAIQTGKFSLESKLKQKWEQHRDRFEMNIKVKGGSPEFLPKMSAINITDPDKAQADTDVYTDWAKSVKLFPTISNIELAPIYKLVDDSRSDVVRKAFELYTPKFNPKLTINVVSQSFRDPINLVPKDKPTIKLNDTAIEVTEPPYNNPNVDPSGFQITILKNIGGYLSEAYSKIFTIDSGEKYWSSCYKKFYDDMADDLEKNPLLTKNNILIVTSFNICPNCCPTGKFASLIKRHTESTKISFWQSNCNPGSMTSNFYISSPANYILISQIQTPQIFELLEASFQRQELETNVKINFMRNINRNDFVF